MFTLIGMFASSLTQVTSDAMRHSLEPVYNEQCQDDFLRTDVSAKIDDLAFPPSTTIHSLYFTHRLILLRETLKKRKSIGFNAATKKRKSP
jgi:hypothetical protein